MYVNARKILSLSLPALGVLIATPLFLLFDTAVVGQLGAYSLAALGAGSTIYAMVTGQLTFISYGTTARASRKYGAGDKQGAIEEGVHATWLALCVGSVLTLTIYTLAPQITSWLANNDEVAQLATSWLRITCFGIPLMLIVMAGNGWLRGIQNTQLPLLFTLSGIVPGAILIPILVNRLGIIGSAWATLIGTLIMAICFVSYLVYQYSGSWRPDAKIMLNQLILGRDLIVRSLSFQIAILAAAAVAARFGPESLAAHQIALQLWNFITLVLDSLAIAAQTLTGAALGAGSAVLAREVGKKVIAYSMSFACVLAIVFLLGKGFLPQIFSSDPNVVMQLQSLWFPLIVMIAVGSIVFSIDGVLLGAADAAFLRTISVLAIVIGYLPGVWLAWLSGSGLVGVWWGILASLVIRLLAVAWRFQSMRWARVEA
ncbi:DNA-damage-inducible membrane protein [Corynebacterium kutscheri]|uniref:DNA-damage-inducible membrane protein n=1 Tax=Corynebacterium kutscheri TaxID=35755 RepID=A0A0F6R0R0_9CORY|nr:MATE family efflux transporter [Corynebacterium kutscheri]AKE41440.1 putative efflux protein, MATE family [Corynebacterium kutscheri]VEH08717.1 DNA-damage-inducible membrane protein [Corynebacterium kutscheri]VEH09764.1 DNA-damage-inducible membrane protein [Corynebacterium kutscheri]VEH79847.1 DNA-damage-inducible membrane protein [Corynebacterium kutscheri]